MDALKQDDQGRWYAEVNPGDGTPSQKFFGETQNDVLNELIKAQSHATKKIRSQAALIKTTPAQAQERSVEFKRRDLSADERFQLAHKLANPGENAEALRSVIEAEFGAPIETIRATLQSVVTRSEKENYAAVGREFTSRYPDYQKTNENEKLILAYLESHKMDFTADNLSIAYEDLTTSNLLQLKQPISTAPAAASTVSTRPRSASTGMTPQTTPRSSQAPVGLTADEIYRMDPAEYKRKLGNPAFVKQVEALFSKK